MSTGNESSQVVSRRSFVKTSQRWTIQQFGLILQSELEQGSCLTSPMFECVGHWQQVLSLESKSDEKSVSQSNEPKYLSFFLRRAESPDRPATSSKASEYQLLAKYELVILTAEEEEIRRLSSTTFRKFEIGSEWGWAKFILPGEIPHSTEDLVFESHIQVAGDLVHTEARLNVAPSQMPKDFAKLLDSASFSDVTFVIGENERIPAHRAILSARSAPMKLLFQSKMKESEEGEVKITDVSFAVFHSLLKFLYTDEFEIEEKHLMELLAVAHRYQIPRLLALCGSKLGTTLTVENVSECLTLAHTFEQEELKSRCLAFINARLQKVIDTDGFEQLSEQHPHVVASILKAQVNGKRKRTDDDSETGIEDGPLTSERLWKMKVCELKAELRRRGLSTAGVKQTLITRLVEGPER